ncbi:MAG: bifunctional oligoribonuclease/PAP phosphatase NrnA [Oscillospiraceae bacterium]|nr:bifunctional oligoribonuclease/PAP phosphatase NrnA [Oscillospiraceae bacterium]
MNVEIGRKILDKIKEYDRILIFRHFRPDGDAVGSSKGMQGILKATFPEKEVYLVNEDFSEFLSFLGPEDAPIADEKFADSLGIVLDTGNLSRISSKKYELCKELIKIDHHINREPYGDLMWVEEEASSACEMVTDFYHTFKDELKITREAANALYTGMVTDSGRFRFRGVSGDTMRCAGVLLDQDIDTSMLYAHLYLEEFEHLKFKAHIYKKMKITPNGVAYLHVDKAMQEKFHLSQEEASVAVSYLEGIKGCLCWIAFIDNDDEEKTIRARLRSRFVTINEIAERYRGGGHACASGATVLNKKEMKALVNEADEHIRKFKETNTEWL